MILIQWHSNAPNFFRNILGISAVLALGIVASPSTKRTEETVRSIIRGKEEIKFSKKE
jgi:hypothetical protein